MSTRPPLRLRAVWNALYVAWRLWAQLCHVYVGQPLARLTGRAKQQHTTTQPRSRAHIHAPATLGERMADLITGFVGSWIFVGLHAGWFILWIVSRIEPFPFGLLTLLVSLEAIFLSTFVMMSQNRSAQKDHLRDDHEADEVDLMYQINQRQLEILELLRPPGHEETSAPQPLPAPKPPAPALPFPRSNKSRPAKAPRRF